jgi:hypothetical protein
MQGDALAALGPGSLQSWAAEMITALREANQEVRAACARGDAALEPEPLEELAGPWLLRRYLARGVEVQDR